MSVSFADSTLPAENSQAKIESFPVGGNQGRLLTKVAFEQHRTWLFLISQNRSNLPSIYFVRSPSPFHVCYLQLFLWLFFHFCLPL